ncbi:heterokaryon incompatibility protein-domain-containing protein [Halenospora varia]|nr:heterokaryon incompatibility protein-domain-containing protein [Halenospora varia]
MLFQCLNQSSSGDQKDIVLFRKGSMLKMDGYEPPVLRICMGLGSEAASTDIQVGFPILHEAGSPIHFKLLRKWLRVCDNHDSCGLRFDGPLPTRVLDVGDPRNSDSLRLHCTEGGERGRYIALSHCWGNLNESQKFCTFGCNIDSLRKGIDFDKLPKTFQDAVIVTRELGERFLWIDSICIIQSHEKCSDECRKRSDWDTESKKMETVFSSAYCTIAASSAEDSTKGFLNPRPPRQCVKVSNASDTPLYICEHIDDFHRDVEEGVLSQRGWVLQERALSRRTIHFTEKQTYWECGKGVHCETLLKMRNDASLLSDSKFPSSAKFQSDPNRIHLFTSFFKMYSKLALTNLTDRPVAISGLESGFARAFSTAVSYGIFQRYLHRSILWKRSRVERMKQMKCPPGRKVPSWSWMACEGEISYMDIPFAKVEWNNAIKLGSEPELQALAREFLDCTIEPQKQNAECDIFAGSAGKIGWLKFDGEDITDTQRLKCIVVGRAREGRGTDGQVHYVLAVMQGLEGGHYERVGVGSIQRRHISFEGREFKARII